jgi:RHS repeat-associated protein
VLDRITYDPYGNIVNQTNSANAPRFRYTGGAYDAITGTYLDGAREDNPADGHWLSQDPLGLGPDSNPYRYVGNEPTNNIDPTGLWEKINFTFYGFSEGQRNILIDVTCKAVEDLEKALAMLTTYWKELEEISTARLPLGKLKINDRYLFLPRVRDCPICEQKYIIKSRTGVDAS